MINYIKDTPNTYWIGMGDYIEGINIEDKRFDEQSVDPTYVIKDLGQLVTIQTEDIISFLTPIKDRCLGLLTGNHEETIRQRYHRMVTYDIAKALGCLDSYVGYDGFIRLDFERQTEAYKSSSTVIVIYTSHGYGAARRSGAKVNKLEEVGRCFDADIIILAHEHKKVIAPPMIRLGLDDRGNLIQRKQIGIMSGSFVRGYVENATTYVEKKMYPPTDIGAVKIMIKPDIRDIHASL